MKLNRERAVTLIHKSSAEEIRLDEMPKTLKLSRSERNTGYEAVALQLSWSKSDSSIAHLSKLAVFTHTVKQSDSNYPVYNITSNVIASTFFLRKARISFI